MNIFNSSSDRTVYFTLVPKSETDWVYKVVDQIDELMRKATIDGILEMSVHANPDRVRVIYDETKTNPQIIGEWLQENGIEFTETS